MRAWQLDEYASPITRFPQVTPNGVGPRTRQPAGVDNAGKHCREGDRGRRPGAGIMLDTAWERVPHVATAAVGVARIMGTRLTAGRA